MEGLNEPEDVRYVEAAESGLARAAEFEANAMRIYRYLRQSTMWMPRDRRPVRIAEMDVSHRVNAAAWLLRRAAWWADMYGWGAAFTGFPRDLGDAAADAWQRELDYADTYPVAWLKETALYRALLDGLPGEAVSP